MPIKTTTEALVFRSSRAFGEAPCGR